jgi:E3 ubiquitin-protein ligase synoviolin
MILITSVLFIAAKYLLNYIDMRSETPWEEKSLYVLYLELVVGMLCINLY